MTVWACIVCFVTGALVVLAAQRYAPSRKGKRPSAQTQATKHTRNFLRYDGTEQAETP